MATILTKRSNTASSVPVAGDLTNSTSGAELAVNTADKRLFVKDSGGTVVELGTNPSAFSNNPTFSAGTANGIPYLNGSKVLTTGSALQFDGTNLGLGVTPSAWGNGQKALDVNGSGIMGSGVNAYYASNAYFNAGWKYKTSSTVALYSQEDGVHKWNIAASGTAGNAISFTQAMTLDASGNLALGKSSADVRLDVRSSIAGGSDNTVAVLHNYSDTGGDTRYAGLTFRIGSDNGTSAIRAYRTNSANNYETNLTFWTNPSGATQNPVERARIDSSGNLLVGTTTAAQRLTVKGTSAGALSLVFNSSAAVMVEVNGSNTVNGVDGTPNANGLMRVWRDSGNLRSISAAGTINASGADYAEYMTKSGEFTIAKGDVVGINAEGKLTTVFADAVSFCVKSTDPSYVGNDKWGAELESDALEAARQLVDRIAFAGQVPVNVMGATPGRYIVPVSDNGAIKGIAKNEADMTLAEYMKAVGKVIAIEADGRAKIIVKVA